MGTVVILKTDGTPVKLNGDFSSFEFDSRGFLATFYYLKKKYVYYGTDNFRKEDKVHANAKGYFIGAGYFMENDYWGYVAKNNPSLKTLSMGLDLLKYEAKVGDEVEVTLLDFGPPYDNYYKSKSCKFLLEAEGKGVRKYKNPKTGELIIPKVVISKIQADQDMNSRPTGLFYAKIFGDFVVAGKEKWQLKPEEKESFSKIATFIVFKINQIVETIFPIILNPLSLRRIMDVAEGKLPEKSLGFLEGTVYNMNKDWGYYFTLTPDHPTLGKMDPIFSGLPDYDEFSDYHNALVSFYEKMYVAKKSLDLMDEKYRFKAILEILPFRAVRSIPFKIRLAKLAEYIRDTFILSSKENLVLKIMCSFSKDEADEVLEFLLEKYDGPKTNFEVLFGKMDDVRLARYQYMEHLVSEATNKRYFTTAVYELWKTSKYNMNYLPIGVDGNEDEINEKSYFLSAEGKNKANEKCVLALDLTIEYTNGEVRNIKSEKAHFESEFAGEKINIFGMKEVVMNHGPKRYQGTNLKKVPLGGFHLYQPISVIGFEPDLECVLPETSFIPAFLFHYAVDFIELKKFDEKLSFAIGIVEFVATSYFTGGLGAFGKMKYLKYLTKLGTALRGGYGGSRILVLAWHGVNSTLNVVNFTADMFVSFDDFFKKSNDVKELRFLREALSEFFMWMTIVSAATSIASNKKLVLAARKTKLRLREIPATQQTFLSTSIENMLDIIGAEIDKIVPDAIADLEDNYPDLSAKLKEIFYKKAPFEHSGDDFSFELIEILTAKNNIDIYNKFNAQPDALNYYNSLDKLPQLKTLILYYEDYYIHTKIHNSLKGIVSDPPVNYPTKEIPVFSEKVYIRVNVDTFKVTTQALLTIPQVNNLLNYLPSSNIISSDRYDIMIKSFACVNQLNYSQIKTRIENYAAFLESGRPYCFSTAEDLFMFKNEVRPLFEKYGLGTDLVFGGSSLLETTPDSVDLTVYLDGINYNNLKTHYRYILKRIDQYQVESRDKTIYINEIKKIALLFNSSTNVLKNSKIKLESLISFEMTNKGPVLKTFQDEFRSLPSVKKIAERQKINFVIYNAKQGDKSVNLGPELTVKI